jgi:nucleotide-binding universal stress UspA family protein
MTGRVVVGYNGSAAGDRAVAWAAKRAAARGLGLRIVHVIDGVIDARNSGELLLAVQTKAQQLLEVAAAVARVLEPDLTVETDVEQGDPLEVFVRLSEDAELLVVGSDWAGEGRPSRRGTRSLRIAAASAAPVAVIPDIDVSGRSGVVVGVDGSELSEHARAFAAAEADLVHQPLMAVHGWMLPNMTGYNAGYPVDYVDYSPELATALEEGAQETLSLALGGLAADYPDLPVRRVVAEGIPEMLLADEAEKASLLVVGSRGHGAVVRLLLGSVSHAVLAHLLAPTVIVR